MGLISEHSAAAATATAPAEQRLRRRKEPMVAENDDAENYVRIR